MPSSKAGVAVSTLGNFAPPAVGLATAPMLASALGPASRGELAATTTILILAVSIGALGLPQTLLFYTARRGTNYRKLAIRITALLGIVGLIFSGCIIQLSGLLSDGDARLAKLISYASLALSPSLILASLRAIASGIQAWVLITSERVISSIIRLIAILVAYLTSTLTLEVATLIIATTTFVGMIAYIPLPKRIKRHTPTSCINPTWQEMVPFSANFWTGIVTGALFARLDQLMLLPLAGAAQLGIYAVAVSIGEMALLFNYAVNAVMNAREAEKPNTNMLAMAARISSLITNLGCLTLALVSLWAVPLMFGDDFLPVIPIVWVLLAGIALGNSGTVVGSGLNGRGRPGLRSASMFIALLINIFSLLLLSPHLGAMGAAIATSLGNIVFGTINILIFGKLYKTKKRLFLGVRRSDLTFLLRALSVRKSDRPTIPVL